VKSRDGLYAGCAWSAIAAWSAVGAYWGLAIAGPSALPAVVLIVAVAVGALGLAVALWTGIGGRRVAIVSLILGLVMAAIPMTPWWASEETGFETRVGVALFGVAVALASAYAVGRRGRATAQPL
jgi:hypothetical protein